MLGNSEDYPPVPNGSSPFCQPLAPSNSYPALALSSWDGSGNGKRMHFVGSVLLPSLCPGTGFSVFVAGQKGKYSSEPDNCHNQGPM